MIFGAHHASMMTQQLKISVLSAPLAAIDRRALSQAWYSALHVNRSRIEPATGTTQNVPGIPPRAAAVPARRPATQHSMQNVPTVFRPAQTFVKPDATVQAERRTTRSALARKIEECFLNPRTRARRATFTIDGTQSRVAVSLQTSGSRVTLVAVCAPTARKAVAKALQEARFALARYGIDLSLETRDA